MGLLARDVVDEVRDAIELSGLAFADVRPLLFEGIAPSFIAKLRVLPEPRYQLVSDLYGMNRVGSLADGTVPLVVWLRNALVLVADPAAAATLRQVYDGLAGGIQRPAGGVPGRRDAVPAVPSGTLTRDAGDAAPERDQPSGSGRDSDRAPPVGPAAPAIFVSHAAEDSGWAEWIAWHLEAAGYEVTVRAWDGVAGANWTRFVDRVAGSGVPLLAVVTATYLASPEVSREWQAVRQADPDATLRRIVPVLVDGTPPDGHLAGLTPIVLTELAEEPAVDVLVRAVAARASGRARPRSCPRFPGPPDGAAAVHQRDERPGFPRHPSDPWPGISGAQVRPAGEETRV